MDEFFGLGFHIIDQLHLYVDDCINWLCVHLNSWIDEIYDWSQHVDNQLASTLAWIMFSLGSSFSQFLPPPLNNSSKMF